MHTRALMLRSVHWMSSYCNDCAEHVVMLSSDFFLLARSEELSPGFDLPYVTLLNATHFCRFAMQSLKCVAIFITMHFNVTNGWNLTAKLLHTFFATKIDHCLSHYQNVRQEYAKSAQNLKERKICQWS